MGSALPKSVAKLDIPDCRCQWSWQKCTCELAERGHGCNCPKLPPPPCRHILNVHNKLNLSEWSELLHIVAGNDYREPERMDRPSTVATRIARVALLAERESLGLKLWNDQDLRLDECEGVGVGASHYRNGRTFETALEFTNLKRAA